MNSARLNEHDANQGAQSSGEFLGMTGNSGWWLLGSGGATIMMVVFLWGILGFSLLLCLLVGVLLCALSLAYVFTLKNNKPEHYDADFFESVFSEAGVREFRFGPRAKRLANPFSDGENANAVPDENQKPSRGRRTSQTESGRPRHTQSTSLPTTKAEQQVSKTKTPAKPTIAPTDAAYEVLHEELEQTKEMLEEALTERPED